MIASPAAALGQAGRVRRLAAQLRYSACITVSGLRRTARSAGTSAPITAVDTQSPIVTAIVTGPTGYPARIPGTVSRIAAQQRVTGPYESIAGYTTDATSAIANWWYLEKKRDGSCKPDSIRAVAVRL